MSLSTRARRAYDAGATRERVRVAIMAGGIVAVALAWTAASVIPAVIGAFLIGYAVSRDPERAYQEGFVDGASFGEQLAADAADSRRVSESRAQLRERLGDDEPGAASRGADEDYGGPAEPIAFDSRRGRGERAGGEAGSRVPAPRTVFEDGNANTALLGGGPRPAPFPVPAARAAGAPSRIESH